MVPLARWRAQGARKGERAGESPGPRAAERPQGVAAPRRSESSVRAAAR